MAINEFVPFSAATGANVQDQAAYVADPQTATGNITGIASSSRINKALRQGTFVAAALAQVMTDSLATDIHDNGNFSAFVSELKQALINTSNMVTYNGNPNGFVAGQAATPNSPPTMCWDYLNLAEWVCVQSGTAATARWIQSSRINLRNSLTLYANSTAGSDAATGLDVSTPFQSLNYTYSYIQQNYNLNGYQITVNCVGTTFAPLNVSGAIGGGRIGGGVIFLGNTANPSLVQINAVNGNAVWSTYGAFFGITGFQLSATGVSPSGGYGIVASQNGQVLLGANVQFAGCSVGHMWASSGYIWAAGTNYIISGNATYHMIAGDMGLIQISNTSVSFVGTPAFTDFVFALNEGYILATNYTVAAGGCTGQRYYIFNNAVVMTNGGGASYFPGNAAGQTVNGGLYV